MRSNDVGLQISDLSGYAYGLRHKSLRLEASERFSYKGMENAELFSCPADGDICKDLKSLSCDYLYLWKLAGFPESNGVRHIAPFETLVSSAFVELSLAKKCIEKLLEEDARSRQQNSYFAVEELVDWLKSFLPAGLNTIHFLEAAEELDLPWHFLSRPLNIIQYGEGRYLNLMKGALSSQESLLYCKIAANKNSTSSYLKVLGYPVQPQRIIVNFESAKDFACKHHFPVVVKPIDSDRGEGVEVDIRDETSLEKIVKSLLVRFKSLIIEKYFKAVDHRLYVWNGAMIWAHRRIPPFVVGDGSSSILELLQAENLSRSLDKSKLALKQIVQDRCFEQCLADQGWNLSTVLPVGTSCQVGSLGLVAKGGSIEGCFHQVHPDNAQLAIDCCKQLDISLGGVDLLVPDISISWKESGAHICEINFNPQLGTRSQNHLYRLILEPIAKTCRIPSVLILLCENSSLHEAISQWLVASSKKMGFNLWSTSRSSGELLRPDLDRRFSSCVALMRFEDLKAVGAPLSRFDAVLIEKRLMNSLDYVQCKLITQYISPGKPSLPPIEFDSLTSFSQEMSPLISKFVCND